MKIRHDAYGCLNMAIIGVVVPVIGTIAIFWVF